MQAEVWKPVEGYEGMYEVSNRGNIRSFDRVIISSKGHRRLIEGKTTNGYDKAGYRYVYLAKNGNTKGRQIGLHRLVAIAFIPNPDNLPEVNHMDCVRSNNLLENLEWVTSDGNKAHAREHNRIRLGMGLSLTHCNRGHEYTPENSIRIVYHGRDYYQCRTCVNINYRKKYHERKVAKEAMTDRQVRFDNLEKRGKVERDELGRFTLFLDKKLNGGKKRG